MTSVKQRQVEQREQLLSKDRESKRGARQDKY